MRVAGLRARITGTVHRAFATIFLRTAPASGGGAASLFEHLQHVLRLATSCPAGPVGDDIRRGACELIEAHSHAAHRAGRRRLLRAVTRARLRHAVGRSRGDDPTPSMTRQLAAALSGGSVARDPDESPRLG